MIKKTLLLTLTIIFSLNIFGKDEIANNDKSIISIKNLQNRIEILENEPNNEIRLKLEKQYLELNELKSEMKEELSKLKKSNRDLANNTESSIAYNIDQFYNSAWNKVTWFLGIAGTIFLAIVGWLFGYLEFKAIRNLESKFENSEKKIMNDVKEKIESYKEVISTYKENTVSEAKKEAVKKVKKSVDKSIVEITETINSKTSNLENSLEKILEEKLEEFRRVNKYIDEIYRLGIKNKNSKDNFDILLKKIDIDDKLTEKSKVKLKSDIFAKRAFSFDSPQDIAGALIKSLEYDDKNMNAWNDLGVTYLNEGVLDKAEECLDKALELDSQNDIFLKNMSTLLIRQKKYDLAVSTLLKMKEISILDEASSMNLKEGLIINRKYKEALEIKIDTNKYNVIYTLLEYIIKIILDYDYQEEEKKLNEVKNEPANWGWDELNTWLKSTPIEDTTKLKKVIESVEKISQINSHTTVEATIQSN